MLKNLRTALIDPDTPSSAKTKTAKDGTTLSLVVCDVAWDVDVKDANLSSFRMNSTRMDEPSMTVMTLTLRPSTYPKKAETP